MLSSILKMLVFCISIVFIIFIIALIHSTIQPDNGIYIQPFDAHAEKNISGETIADLLRFELQKIKAINEQDLMEIMASFQSNALNYGLPGDVDTSTNVIASPSYEKYLPAISSETNPIDYRLPEIGTVGTGGVSLSLGQILSTVKEYTSNERRLTGGVQKSGSNISIIAFLYDPYSHRGVTTWEVKRPLPRDSQSFDELIPTMVEELAFQIANDLSKREGISDKNYPQTWQAFKYLTLSRAAYHRYIATRDIKDLEQACDIALSAKHIEPSYSPSFELLSTLGLTYLDLNRYNKAEQLFQNVYDLNPAEGAFELGLVYFAQKRYNDAIDNYSISIEFDPHYSAAWGSVPNFL